MQWLADSPGLAYWVGEKIGLGWVNFRFFAELTPVWPMAGLSRRIIRRAGIDPKVRADQMGNGIGVNLDEYTMTGLDQRTAAVELLAASILQ